MTMRDLTGTASFVLILFVAASTVPASAEACKGSDAPTPELRHYDATATRPLPEVAAIITTPPCGSRIAQRNCCRDGMRWHSMQRWRRKSGRGTQGRNDGKA